MKRLEDLGFKIVKEGLEMYEKNQQSLVLETKGRSDWFHRVICLVTKYFLFEAEK